MNDYEIKKKVESQSDPRNRYMVVKLPCGDGNVQITKAQDQYLVCPKCYKRWALTWALRDSAKKIQEV